MLPSLPRRRGIPKFLRWLIWIAVGSLLALVLAWFAVDAWAMNRLERARAAFGEHGFPMSLEEILPQPVPEEQNAAPLLEAAWHKMVGDDSENEGTPEAVFVELIDLAPAPTEVIDGVWHCPPTKRTQIRALAAQPQVLDLCAQLRAATNRPSFVPSVDYRLGPATTIPYVAHIRDFTRVLTACALAQAGDPATEAVAWENIAASLTLANWAGSGITVIEGLTGIVCAGNARSAMLGIIEGDISSASIERSAASLRQLLDRQREWFARGCHGERLSFLGWFDRKLIAEGGDFVDMLAKLVETTESTRKLPPSFSHALSRVMRPYAAREMRLSYELHLSAVLSAREVGPAASARWHDIVQRRNDTRGLLTPILMPVLDRVALIHRVETARLQLTIIALEALDIYRRTGGWPPSVGELALSSDVLLDPCSGQAIMLRATDENLLVYACGLDGDDDDGRAAEKPASFESNGDIAVRLRLREHRRTEFE